MEREHMCADQNMFLQKAGFSIACRGRCLPPLGNGELVVKAAYSFLHKCPESTRHRGVLNMTGFLGRDVGSTS